MLFLFESLSAPFCYDKIFPLTELQNIVSHLMAPGLEPLDTDFNAAAGEFFLVAVRHCNIAPI
jgi:hypothetical protein